MCVCVAQMQYCQKNALPDDGVQARTTNEEQRYEFLQDDVQDFYHTYTTTKTNNGLSTSATISNNQKSTAHLYIMPITSFWHQLANNYQR